MGSLFSVVVATFFTAFYSFRLFVTVFLKQFNASLSTLYIIHESLALLLMPLQLLLFGSIFMGFLFSDFFLGVGNIFFSTTFSQLPFDLFLFETDLLFLDLKFFIFIILTFLSGGLMVFIYSSSHLFSFKSKISNTYWSVMFLYFFLFNAKWFFDSIYNKCINTNLFN